MKDKKLLLTLLMGFVMPLFVFGQSNNPANRYTDVYKQYLDATCPIGKDSIKHFVYFARDREIIINHPFLKVPRFAGAQIMYSWKQLEQERGQYDFSIIHDDYSCIFISTLGLTNRLHLLNNYLVLLLNIEFTPRTPFSVIRVNKTNIICLINNEIHSRKFV